MLARQYSISEIQTLLKICEGEGPGLGGHAIGTHGHLRKDVSDRNKPNDSAFQKEIRIFGKRLVVPGKGDDTVRTVPPVDQAMVVALALNSTDGQKKLLQLDTKPDTGIYNVRLTTEMQSLAQVLPELRIGNFGVKTNGSLPRVRLELFKINSRLHVHTVYAMPAANSSSP